jgi:hypothetical protein
MKKPQLLAGLLAIAGFVATATGQILTLQPMTTFGPNGDGSLRPDQADASSSVIDFTSSGSAQRGMAYNPTTGHILFVSRTNYVSPNDVHIYVLDGATGTNILDGNNNPLMLDITSSFATGGNASFPYNLISISDDGSIYACNLSSATTPPQFRLYRWENETAPQQLVYFDDPSGGNTNNVNRRWGDTMAIRGAGLNTQILLASRGSLAAILTPTDSSLTFFTSKTLQTDVTTAEGMGYGLAFGSGNTFWAKGASSAGLPLLQLSFDLNAGTATTVHAYSVSDFPGRVGPITVSGNLLAAVDPIPGADLVRLYDISNLANPPLLLDRKTFGTNINNNIFAGAVAFGNGNTLYALDTDNGLMAFNLVSAPNNQLAPALFLQPDNQVVQVGSNVVFSAKADGTAPLIYQWYYNSTNLIPGAASSSYNVNNAQLTNAGGYSVVVTNAYGAITSSVANLTVLTTAPGIIAYEPFAYASGTAIGTAGGTFGGWLLNSGTSGTIEAGNLDVPGLASSSSNRYTWTSANSSVRLPIGTNISGEVYFSFALRIDTVGTFANSDTIAGFGTGTSTAFSFKLNVQVSPSGGYNLGVFKAGGTTFGAFATNDFSSTDTVFVVGRYTFSPAGSTDDTCDLWLNPDPSTFGQSTPPTPTVGPIGNGAADGTQIDRFFWRAAGGPAKHTADELRVGVNWASVTPPASSASSPKLSVMLSGSNAILSWPTSVSGFSLQSSTTISPASWSSVGAPIIVSGTNNTVTVPTSSGKLFFRLIK